MKKFLAVAIAAIMILSISSIPAFAVSTSDAVVNIDFANGIPAGMEVVGAELAQDADKGQVLSFAGGDTGSSKAVLPVESFKTTDFKSGLAWTVWVKADTDIHGMAPIFNIDFTTQGYLTLHANLGVTANTDGNQAEWGIERVWADPTDAGNEESVLKNEWTHLAIVIDDQATYLYVNGKLYEKNPFANGSLFDIPNVVLEQMGEYATGIQLGSYNCDWWKFGDFKGLMSSAALYNKALTADEVKDLFVSTGGEWVEETTTEASTTTEADTTVADEGADTETDTSAEASANNETTTNASDDSEESNNNLMIILIIAGAAVVVVIVIIVVVNSGKKGKK